MRYGYARVSKSTQSLDRQLDMLNSYGVDEIVTESVSGIGKQIELENLILRMKKGDVLIVTRLSRLGRSSQSVLKRLSVLQANGIDLIAISGGKVDTTTPQGKLFWSLITLFDELERDYISMRTKEGLATARKKGRLLGRPPIKNTIKNEVILMHKKGYFSKQQIANACGISRNSVYKIINEHEDKE